MQIRHFCRSLIAKFEKFCFIERIYLPCWIPIFLSIGILIGFKVTQQSLFYLVPFLILLLFLIYYAQDIAKKSIIAICFTIIGILVIQTRIKIAESPIIPFDNKFIQLEGIIDNIIPLEQGYRILLKKIVIKGIKQESNPYKARVTIKTNLGDAKVGDFIKFNAILSKPMHPYLPDSYNFARDAYFKKIGAVGYSVSDIKILSSSNGSINNYLNSLRNNIQVRVTKAIGTYSGSIATALMLNEYSNIDKIVLKNLRATGLAHILSVSGMHLSLVVTIFFFSSRFLLNCFQAIALRNNVKKLAAFCALLGSSFYLLISGMEVAAIRSFIMTSLIIIAIILDRTPTPMRAVAFAATIILLITPENIIHPSFQMSFAAVLALISCFEAFSKVKFNFSEFNIVQKCLFYILTLCLASLVAGLATAPFALYHFNQSSNYSILANLIAVPITSFWLMPCVVLTFFLYPFHLECFSLKLMQYGIELVIKIAEYIANMPYSVSVFAKMTDVNLLIIVFGMLWLCIWSSKIRLYGVLIICCGVILQSFEKKPDIFVDWVNNKVAVLDNEDNLIFLSKPLGEFKKQVLMSHVGAKAAFKYKDISHDWLRCRNKICEFYKKNTFVHIDLQEIKITIMKDKNSPTIIKQNEGISFIKL